MRRYSLAIALLLLVQVDASHEVGSGVVSGEGSGVVSGEGSGVVSDEGSGVVSGEGANFTVPHPECNGACGESGWSGTGAGAVNGTCHNC